MAAAIAGALSLSAHLAKAGSRIVINTSPEPFSNSVASVTEDGIVLGLLWLIFHLISKKSITTANGRQALYQVCSNTPAPAQASE